MNHTVDTACSRISFIFSTTPIFRMYNLTSGDQSEEEEALRNLGLLQLRFVILIATNRIQLKKVALLMILIQIESIHINNFIVIFA